MLFFRYFLRRCHFSGENKQPSHFYDLFENSDQNVSLMDLFYHVLLLKCPTNILQYCRFSKQKEDLKCTSIKQKRTKPQAIPFQSLRWCLHTNKMNLMVGGKNLCLHINPLVSDAVYLYCLETEKPIDKMAVYKTNTVIVKVPTGL